MNSKWSDAHSYSSSNSSTVSSSSFAGFLSSTNKTPPGTISAAKDKKKKQKAVASKLRATGKLRATETEVDDFLRSIKAVPSDEEINDFLRCIKAVPDEDEINDFLRSIKAEDEKGKPMLYRDGQPVVFAPQGPSPFATESMDLLKKSGTIKLSEDQKKMIQVE